jgi:putative sterol carrier protein
VPIVFSDAWARAWGDALAASETYRTAAAAWEGSVALVAAGPALPEPAAVFLDLWHGECREARRATEGDLAGVAYLLEAEPGVWRELFESRQSPVMALLTGRLRLVRGELAQLLPHAGSAKELLALAETIEGEFPSTW